MSPDSGSEMICGGKMEVLLLSWSREDLESLIRKADCTGDLLYLTDAGGAICIEPMLPPNSLILAGAGHIAHPLAAIGRMLGFHITIIDDMEYYARPERFPMADRVIAGNFHEVISGLHSGNHSQTFAPFTLSVFIAPQLLDALVWNQL